MKNVHRLGVALVLIHALANPVAAQVPVTDVAHMGMTEANQSANIAKYAQMIQEAQAQVSQLKAQYEALTGSRGLGKILNNPEFANYLPTEWQDVYQRVQEGGYSGLTGSAAAIRDANKLFDACTRRDGVDKTACERQSAKAAQDKAFASEAFDKARDRLDQIEGLMNQIDGTTDPKAIAELQARIGAEQAAIQNEQTKLQMYQMIAAAEDRLIEQQQREASAKSLARRGYVTPNPVNFNE